MKNKTISYKKALPTLALVLMLVTGFIVAPIVRADQYDAQIRALSAENSEKRGQINQLQIQAADLNDKISKLQAQIDDLQRQIDKSNADIADTEARIKAAEEELARQKKLLGANIKAMYLEGQISTVEMLASSKDLSDFFDKAQYRSTVKDKIKSTVDKITALRLELKAQKQLLEDQRHDQELRQNQVDAQRDEQARLLNLNEADRNNLNNDIKHNYAQIVELRRQQAVENSKHFNGSHLVNGGACSPRPVNDYPDDLCARAQDSVVDPWGLYNRECVSYTAWKVYSTRGYMPYGYGNANQWDGHARADGIPVDGSPRPGDVAVAHWGYYGHVMYVESVNSNGTINVSQYNWDYNGTYSEMYGFSASGLVFIHF
ncbi:MAG TPA: CHAP domain-containing protein [Patescibacteria group bacterium]|nr:CHAP domain-containing protein [Patescibacteria group bacterium]